MAATVSITYSSSRNIVYLVLDGASFLNSDSGGDVLAAWEAVTACFVSASTSGSFGKCGTAVAASGGSVAASEVSASFSSFFSYITHSTITLV